MKRCIRATETTTSIESNADIVVFLQNNGIDTTKNQYELSYVFFGRFGEDSSEKVRFTCPGDYLALFSTRMAGTTLSRVVPNFANIDRYFGIEDFIEIVEKNPTFDDLYNYGEDNEWFGREEFGNIKLVNLTTGNVIAKDEDGYVDEDYYEEDWKD